MKSKKQGKSKQQPEKVEDKKPVKETPEAEVPEKEAAEVESSNKAAQEEPENLPTSDEIDEFIGGVNEALYNQAGDEIAGDEEVPAASPEDQDTLDEQMNYNWTFEFKDEAGAVEKIEVQTVDDTEVDAFKLAFAAAEQKFGSRKFVYTQNFKKEKLN